MPFQWSQQAPAFEFPTCYRTENRFLTLRAAALAVLALMIIWVAVASPDVGSAAIKLTKARKGASEPHVLIAIGLLLLAGIDLWAVSRQQRIMLAPGQPAALASELMRLSRGVSSGAAWLKQLLTTGTMPVPSLRVPYRRALLAVAPHIATTPSSLQGYLSLRIAHFLFAAGLLLTTLLTWLIARPPTLALACLLYSALATALVARSAWITKTPPSPTAVVVVLVSTTLAGSFIAWLGGGLPAIDRLASLGLYEATLVLLSCLMLIEGLAVMAARFPTEALPVGQAAPQRVDAELVADPDRLLEELERELHRYWTEGVPNRRFAWQTSPPSSAQNDESRFLVSVLEESQPLLPPELRDGIPPPPMGRKLWLLVLGAFGLLATVAGGVLWMLLAHAQAQPVASAWTSAGPALVLIIAGGYACRVGHFLWSRIEVDSTLISLDCRRAGSPTMATPSSTSDKQALQLRVGVAYARSVFYAASDHKVGSRMILGLRGDEDAARRSIEQLRAYTDRAASQRVTERAPAPGPAPERISAAAPPPAAAATGRAKFCPGCGTPVLQPARFCQHCGASLRMT